MVTVITGLPCGPQSPVSPSDSVLLVKAEGSSPGEGPAGLEVYLPGVCLAWASTPGNSCSTCIRVNPGLKPHHRQLEGAGRAVCGCEQPRAPPCPVVSTCLLRGSPAASSSALMHLPPTSLVCSKAKHANFKDCSGVSNSPDSLVARHKRGISGEKGQTEGRQPFGSEQGF